MERFYLIDFENVGTEGLTGCEKLGSTDHILIFFTCNARKIDMSWIANHGQAKLDMLEIPAGKQSADIHICSYIGFLVGSCWGKDTIVTVVSKDTDFDRVISFWKERTGARVARQPRIDSGSQPVKVTKRSAQEKPAQKPKAAVDRVQLNSAVMKAMSKAGFDQRTTGETASVVASHYGKTPFYEGIREELREKRPDYEAICRVIRPLLEGEVPEKTPGPSRNEINNEIQKLLSRAGLGSETVGMTASLVAKNLSSSSGKQRIYQEITSEFGQKVGQEVYGLIRDYLAKL